MYLHENTPYSVEITDCWSTSFTEVNKSNAINWVWRGSKSVVRTTWNIKTNVIYYMNQTLKYMNFNWKIYHIEILYNTQQYLNNAFIGCHGCGCTEKKQNKNSFSTSSHPHTSCPPTSSPPHLELHCNGSNKARNCWGDSWMMLTKESKNLGV